MPYNKSDSFELKFYEKPDGECQVRDYLRSGGKALSAKAGSILRRLQEKGPRIRRPEADYLRDGIFELRIKVERNQHRILYFFNGGAIVLTNAFLKSSRQVPREEIDRATKFREDWLRREERK